MQQSVTSLLDAFASSDPTPGGGSASALAGAIGVSLLAMVAGMPKHKTNTPEAREALDKARARLMELRGKLIALVDHDAVAYDLVVAAYKHPKSTDDEKAIRKKAIQDAMRVATEVPLETIRASVAALDAAESVAEHGNPNAVSDVGVGIHLLMTAIQGALFNVEINLGGISDPAVVDELAQQLKILLGGAHSAQRGMSLIQKSGLMELMKKTSARIGMQRGNPPPGYTSAVAELLRRMATPEARRALEALAESDTGDVAEKARAALDKFAPADPPPDKGGEWTV